MDLIKFKSDLTNNIIDRERFSEAFETNVVASSDIIEEIEDMFERLEKEIAEEKKKTLSASEALFGFIGQLTRSKEKFILSSSDDAAPVCDKIGEFCKANNLESPGKDWTDKIVK